MLHRVLVSTLGVVAALGCGEITMPPATEASSGGAGAGGAGGSPNEDCWPAASDGVWQLEPAVLDKLSGVEPTDPMLSDEGLTLFYMARAEPAAPFRVHQATRPSRELAFEGGLSLGDWFGLNSYAQPWRVGDELYLSHDVGGGAFQLHLSLFDGAAWSKPVALQLLPGYSAADSTLTADGRRLMFRGAEQIGGPFTFYEGARADASPGTPFSTFAKVTIPELDEADVVLCPVLSPDGLRLFFSTTHPHDIASGVPDGALTVWISERSGLDYPWQPPVHITAFDHEADHTCVQALSSDGCEIWLSRFPYGLGYALARREPHR